MQLSENKMLGEMGSLEGAAEMAKAECFSFGFSPLFRNCRRAIEIGIACFWAYCKCLEQY